MAKIHLCMVSDQSLANILPALAEPTRPDKVLLLATPQQSEKGNDAAQAEVLKNRGIQAEIIPLEGAFDPEAIQTQMGAMIDQHPGDELLLNATGGTKPMSIAAYEQAYTSDLEVFYLQGTRVLWLNADPLKQRSAFDITEQLNVLEMLNAHAVKVEERRKNRLPQRLLETSLGLAKLAQRRAAVLGKLNYYAYLAKTDGALEAQLQSQDLGHDHFKGLLYELEKVNIAEQQNDRLLFPNEEARFFANGGWLEELLFTTLREIQANNPAISDVAASVKVVLSDGKTRKAVRNELDVVAVVNNQLWVFECKTKRLADSKGSTEETDTQHMIYKLAGLMKSLGGLRTRGCVVSFNPVTEFEKSRAELFDIQVIDGSNLINLRSLLSNMLSSANS